MKRLAAYKKFMLPPLIAFIFASVYIVGDPGKIVSDASEYDRLADSILIGQYNLDGSPSMLREPGYPAFRAVLKFFGAGPEEILWTQAIMYAATVFLIGLATFKIDLRTGVWGGWGAALAYGLAFYPSVHLSENLTAFLLAVIGLLLVTAIQHPKRRYWILLGLACGALLFTRYALLLIPVACALVLVITSQKQGLDKKNIFVNAFILLFITGMMVIPWMLRNYKTFGVANVAGRFGAITYARAWKTDASWRSLADSYLSVFIGRGLLFTLYPNSQPIFQEQWGSWWRDPEKIKKWGSNPVEVDQNRKGAAIKLITSDVNHFSKFIIWTGVDMLRFLALPNPVFPAEGSPIEGTYGPLAQEKKLSFLQASALVLVHIVQLLWFTAIILSVLIGLRKYGWRFIPGLFLIALVLPHSIGDGTARHGIVIQPWLLAGIFMTIGYPLYRKLKFKIRGSTAIVNKSRDLP